MSFLNQNLDFSQLSPDVQLAFSGMAGNKILLPFGTSLFRFSGHSNISPWWSEIAQLPQLLLSAKASGQRLFQYIRNHSAVLRKWDPDMQHLIIASLNQPVYAFSGGISPQNEAAAYMNAQLKTYKRKFTKPVFFGGGNGQVYIKDLDHSYINIIVPAGTINIYDNVDEILDFLIDYKII
ncbi:MAG TPA: hypothetical protein VMT76_14925 [Puia sp.]|nr:hypothetical protein [Puia sp.]